MRTLRLPMERLLRFALALKRPAMTCLSDSCLTRKRARGVQLGEALSSSSSMKCSLPFARRIAVTTNTTMPAVSGIMPV